MGKLQRVRDVFLDIILVLSGTFLYAAGLYFFLEPCQMAPGGVSGIALLINYLTHLPVGILTAAMNIPLILVGYRFVGKAFFWKTVLSVVSFTALYDYVLVYFPVYEGEPLLSCLFGGVLWGLGFGLVFMRSGSTGGTDVIIKIIHQWRPHLQFGKVSFILDGLIILASIFVFHSLESGLYAIVAIFVTAQVMDAVIYSGDKGKLIYIFSARAEEIAGKIMATLNRGTTFLQAKGGYTKEERDVLMCAVRNNEYYTVKRMVHDLDPKAFIIVSDSSEVMGEGFIPLDKET